MSIQTVRGKISPEAMGVTMMHEHMLMESFPTEEMLAPYRNKPEYSFIFEPVSLENRSWIRYYKSFIIDNCVQLDENVCADELDLYKAAGGGTLLDVSSYGVYRDPVADVRLSERTGVNIVLGTGLYVEADHPAEFAAMDSETMAKLFIRELTVGVGDTGIRCGIIGEMGISLFREPEQRAMKAAAIAHCDTGAAVTVHLDYYESGVADAVKLLLDNGVEPTRIVLGHSDRWWDKPEVLVPYLDKGLNVEFDTFGTDYVLSYGVYFPNDFDRVRGLRRLCDLGYGGQLLVAHDTYSKGQLVRYGGGGYVHILRHIVPTMKALGFKDEEIKAILVDNPARIVNID